MLTGEVFLSCTNVTFEHCSSFQGQAGKHIHHWPHWCFSMSCFQSCLQWLLSLPHVNVYLFFPHSLSLSPSLLSLGCFLAGALDYCADQDLSSGWVNISFFCVCACVWVWCDDEGKSLMTKVGVTGPVLKHVPLISPWWRWWLSDMPCVVALFSCLMFNLWSFLLPHPLFA